MKTQKKMEPFLGNHDSDKDYTQNNVKYLIPKPQFKTFIEHLLGLSFSKQHSTKIEQNETKI